MRDGILAYRYGDWWRSLTWFQRAGVVAVSPLWLCLVAVIVPVQLLGAGIESITDLYR